MSLSLAEQKQLAAKAAVDYIENDMTLGLGFGSTFMFALEEIGVRVKSGLSIKAALPSTLETARRAREFGIPVIDDANLIEKIDLAIDGADEATETLNLIKGGGGALTREKIVASMSDQVIIIADETKFVQTLGQFPLPIEVIPFGAQNAIRQIMEYSPKSISIRHNGDEPFKTDNGNFIIDCKFGRIENPFEMHQNLNAIPGVVDNGLFCGLCDLLIVADHTGKIFEYFG